MRDYDRGFNEGMERAAELCRLLQGVWPEYEDYSSGARECAEAIESELEDS